MFSVRHELRLTKELVMKRIITSQHNQVEALRSIKCTLAMGIKRSTCETVEQRMNFMSVPSYDGHMASHYILEIHYCLSTSFDTKDPCILNRFISIFPSGLFSSSTALQAGRSRVRFPMVSWEFFIYTVLPAALWPWV